jgi:hypothetical protein
MKKKDLKRNFLIVTLLVLVAGLILVLAPFFQETYFSFYYPAKNFHQELWREGDFLERGTMIDDLEGNVLRIGMGREEIVERLGEPDRSPDKKIMVYEVDVGMRWLGSPWLYSLNIEFDSEDRVEKFYVMD